MTTPWLTDEEQRVWRQWLRAHDVLTAELGRQLQPHGLGLQDYALLVHLTDQASGRLRMSELAELLQWDRSRLSHHVKRMTQRGLVDRETCSEDRRGAYVRVTDLGREALTRAAPTHVQGVRETFFADLTAGEVAALDRITTAVIERSA